MKEIIQYTKDKSDILRNTSKEVPVFDITSKSIQNIINSMKNALASQNDGVAIAAPQIGENVRIFVVSGKVFSLEETESPHEDEVFINPRITKRSRKKKELEEGCLSVRWLYGKVKRHEKVTVEAYDENGKKIIRGGSGLLSQIFQHEIDHLDGILFIDNARDIEEYEPEQPTKS